MKRAAITKKVKKTVKYAIITPLHIMDLFIVICEKMQPKEIFDLKLLSKRHCNAICNHSFPHLTINFNQGPLYDIQYTLANNKFTVIDLTNINFDIPNHNVLTTLNSIGRKFKQISLSKILMCSLQIEFMRSIVQEKPFIWPNLINARNSAGLNILFMYLVRSRIAPLSKIKKDIILKIIRNGVEIDCPNKSGIIPLANAIIHEDWELVELLLSLGSDPNYYGSLLINHCIFNNKLNILELLLKYGANPNQINTFSVTGDVMYDIYVSYNSADKFPCTSLMFSLARIHNLLNWKEHTDMLIKYGAKLENDLLLWAMLYCCSLEAIQYLENKGLDINQVDSAGNNLLMNLFTHNHPELMKYEYYPICRREIVDYLICKTTDINTLNNKGQNAAMLLMGSNVLLYDKVPYSAGSILQEMRKKGIRLDIIDLEGHNLLTRSIISSDHFNSKVIDVLLEDSTNRVDTSHTFQDKTIYALLLEKNVHYSLVNKLFKTNSIHNYPNHPNPNILIKSSK